MRGPRSHLDHLFTSRRLSAYVDGDLDPYERERVRRHLDECADCGRAERSLRKVLGGLRLLRRRRSSRRADRAIERVRLADRSPEVAGRH